jgi:GTP:adenosylcobinamide-phosphate guanylyltransferase
LTGSFNAIALAGGALETDFRRAGYDVPNKAYLTIGGETMLVRVLRALRGSRAIKQIRCVTPLPAADTVPQLSSLVDRIVQPGDDLIDSVLAGVAELPSDERVVISATDMPLLTATAVDAFAQLAAKTPCDIGYGFVERSVHERSYPSVRHTWVRLKGGTFCGAGLSVIRAGCVASVANVLRTFTGARKSPLRLAALFSPLLVVKILTAQLSVGELERRASELTGLVCRGVECPYPELAVNVDHLNDLAEVESIIRYLP